ncbi:MAG: hypothetical protein PHY48_14820 [Candidatus Cloacimonetes bacterium]|nr:hypothetical protein [Candidatus Cloacimonadota bacterium]
MSLSAKDKVGSKIRCLFLSEIIKHDPTILDNLVNLESVKVPKDPYIIPCGMGNPEELVLNRGIAEDFITELIQRNGMSNFKEYNDFKCKIEDWWLEHPAHANTPNWDTACIAKIDGRDGLILVEAKAHKAELSPETKTYDKNSSNSEKNHERIIGAIERTSQELRDKTGIQFNLSEHSPYQLSNRFAWSWFLAQNGIPVVLVYLGFIDAKEMKRKLFINHEDVEKCVKEHCKDKNGVTIYVPDEAWKQEPLFNDNYTTMYSVIRSMNLTVGKASIKSINGNKC